MARYSKTPFSRGAMCREAQRRGEGCFRELLCDQAYRTAPRPHHPSSAGALTRTRRPLAAAAHLGTHYMGAEQGALNSEDGAVGMRQRRFRHPIGQALIYPDGRVRWSMLAQTEAEFAAMYPIPNICGRHFDALARELRAWREVSG